ncbi:MAG: coproporphyrinogen-III oxidase family protein, partial [Candidatus Binatia bacterium]
LRLNENTRVASQLTAEERLDLKRLIRWRSFVKQAADGLGFEQGRTYAFKRPRNEVSRVGTAPPPRQNGLSYQLGVGMSARSQLGTVVYRNHERSSAYVERMERGLSPVESVFELDVDDRKTQYLAGSLCNALPLERSDYERTFGATVDGDFGELLDRLRRAELIDDDGTRIVLTETGKLVYDRVLLCFYPQRAKHWLYESTDHHA